MYSYFLLAAAALASAYTTPTTQCTDGCNPVRAPGLNAVVPVGTPYTVTWDPTTSGTVTLVLEKGPSTNILPLYAIAEKIANTGSFSWTPAADLEPTGNAGYGLQIINDADGTFQWSNQFGISNAGFVSSSSVSTSASASTSASGSAWASGYASWGASATASGSTATFSSVYLAANGTVISSAPLSNATAAATTGAYSNSTAVISSASLTAAVSSTLTIATGSSGTKTSASATASSGAGQVVASVSGAFFALVAAAFAL